MTTEKRKQSVYFGENDLQDIKDESERIDRSLSWVLQRAWKISRSKIKESK